MATAERILREVQIEKMMAMPRYLQLYEQIRPLLVAGTVRPGDRIPSDNELMAAFGLSRATVRQAIDGLVRDGLVERVRGVGTFVAATDQAPSVGTASCVALFLDTPPIPRGRRDGFYSDILQHLLVELGAEQFQLRPVVLGGLHDLRCALREHVSPDLRGAFFLGRWVADNHEALKEAPDILGVPTVFIDEDLPGSGGVSVVSRNTWGAHAATTHLLQLGHRRVGYVGSHAPNGLVRFEGYCRALSDFSMPVPSDCVWHDWEAAARSLSDAPNSVSALFCAGDWLAVRTIGLLCLQGRRVPEDVSIVSYDDTELLEGITPPVTAVSVDRADIAHKAFRALKGELTGPRIEAETQLVIRDSTQPFAP